MVKLLRFTLLFFCVSYVSLASDSSNDSIFNYINNSKLYLINDVDKSENRSNTNTSLSIKTSRSFKELAVFDISEEKVKKFQENHISEGFNFQSADSTINKKWLQMANNTFETIDQTQNYIDVLDSDDLSELPVAIRPQMISNVSYTVGVAKAVFKPSYSELTVFLKVDTPKGTLILGANDIKLSHEGGIIGDARLQLISQFTIDIDKGNAIITLNGSFEQPATYALIDCSGFKELGIDADLKFSKGFIYPVDSEGNEINGYVESNFKIIITDWNDLVVNITLPDFGVKGLKGTTFSITNAVLDFSDVRNDNSMPQEYLSKYVKENPNLWRGVYIKELRVVLPKEFKKKNQDKRIAFSASEMIIDSQGITGTFIGENILNIDEGSASKWKFSLDRFALGIETNTLVMGQFSGELVLPVSEIERLQYNAVIKPDAFTLQVSSANQIDFNLWNAQVSLTEDSYIEMTVKDGKFLPKASLHGSVNFASGLGKDTTPDTSSKVVDFKGITFQNMLLQAEAPKFSVDYFGYKGNLAIAGFPISIREIGLTAPQNSNRAALLFDFDINLTSKNDGNNGGGAQLIINSKLEDDNGRDSWKFDGIDLERINVRMDINGNILEGAVFIFDEDPTYGTGFAGALSAKFKGLEFKVKAKALFGRTSEFRYWFADAQATFPQGIPIFTGFALNTFGGGLYSRMKIAGVSSDPNASMNQIGVSSSGIIYAPEEKNGLGFKAMVGMATQNSEELFHATVEFGMTFKKSGGLHEIYLKGYGELLAALPADFSETVLGELTNITNGEALGLPSTPPSGAMSVDVYISYNFTEDIFHATSEIYINFGIVKGSGAAGKAGWLDFYVSPDEWHILIGTPDGPVGLSMNLGILRIDTNAYFMTGQDLPNSPPPPTIVAEILGLDASKLDYTRDLGQLKSGSGLAFGAHLSVTTGDLRFLIFYARFDAGLGFDIMIKDYGDAHCKGSSEQIGLNGWYANGQAYAYLQGELGLYFKLFGKKKKIPIVKGGAAVIVQARLPNPAWFQGYMGGHYNLLGGLVKGKFRFKLELGEKCEIIGGSPIDGIVAIGDMTPKDSSKDVDVFASPQVVFNMQLNKVFEIPDETGDRKYRIMLDDFKVTKSGKPIIGEIEWNDQNDVAVFHSHEILPPNATIKSYVQVHFEEFVNGRWEIIKENGKASLETKEISFTTGKAPKTIPEDNINFMYPVSKQQNLYIKQYDKGYINLDKGQEYLFQPVPTWKKTISFNGTDGRVLETPFSYNTAKKQLVFLLPKGLETATAYDVRIILVPPASGSLDGNVNTQVVKTSLDKAKETEKTTGTFQGQPDGRNISGSDIEIKSKTASGTIISGEERELLTYSFRTSAYVTFQKKMKAMRENDQLYRHITYPYGLALVSKIDYLEPFDLVELVGNDLSGNTPLVNVRAVLDNKYYKEKIYPLLYKNYPLGKSYTVDRKTDKIGVPPVEGVEPLSWYLTYLENNFTGETNLYNPYRYNVTNYFHQDYDAIRYKVVNSGNYAIPGLSTKLITDPFPLMYHGKYKTTYSYILPGQENPSTSQSVKYTNPLYE